MRKTLLALLLAAPCLALAQTPIHYTISGRIGNLNAPAKVYLIGMVSDSATLKNGAFTFTGTAAMPVPIDVVLQRAGKMRDQFAPSPESLRIFLEPGPIVITSPDSLLEDRAKVTGGPLTTDNERFRAMQLGPAQTVRAVRAEAAHATEAQKKDPAFAAHMQAQYASIDKEFTQAYLSFIRANPNSWVSLHALQTLQMMELPRYEVVGPLYNALNPELKNSRIGRDYGDMVAKLKALAVGAPAPGFTQNTPEGKPVSLADYRGKYVLVDFWASWCGPCRAESPAIAKVYQQYKSRKFDVLGVSLDKPDGRDNWLKAIADDYLSWAQVSDLRGFDNQVARLYGVRGIPQNYLIGPDGKIVAVNLKGEALNATLAKLLK